jgi:hypothetical protein
MSTVKWLEIPISVNWFSRMYGSKKEELPFPHRRQLPVTIKNRHTISCIGIPIPNKNL